MSQLPPDVIDALQRGQVIEAIKRLRQATGLGLKQAKDAVDARQLGQPTAFTGGMGGAAPMPPAAVDALRSGNKIEAIRLVREHTGLGLKAAKDKVDGFEAQMPDSAVPGGLSPGEVRGTGGALPWVVGVGVAAAVTYFFFG